MPVFEYRCRDCGHVTEVLERSGDRGRPPCSKCGSQDTEKLFSAFGLGRSAASGTSPASCSAGSSRFK